MSNEFELGVEQARDGRSSPERGRDQFNPFRDDSDKAERRRGYEAGIIAKTTAEEIAKSLRDDD